MDLILFFFYLLIILIIAYNIKKRNIVRNPVYRYFIPGLSLKIFGGIAVCLIYAFYYGDGDTTWYYHSALCMVKLFQKNPGYFFETWLTGPSLENYFYFDESTGYPLYWFDPPANFLCRLIVPFIILGGLSYIPATMLMAAVSFIGIWKFYLIFAERFPVISDKLAIAILFMPSVFFWGSGMLKDTATLASLCWYTYSFHEFFIKKKRKNIFIFIIITSTYFILQIKPYIFFALLPGSIIWLFRERVERIRNKVFRTVVGPIALTLGIFTAYYSLLQAGDLLGQYSLETVLFKAKDSQTDLKQSYYQGNSFDIGDYEPNMEGALSVAHMAVFAGLFYPTILQVKNVVMFLAALENSFIILFTFYLLFKLRIYRFFTYLVKDPLLLFSFLFAVFFAFSVGISVSNFGTLVRLRIPCIPFYIASLFILQYFYNEKKRGEKFKKGLAFKKI